MTRLTARGLERRLRRLDRAALARFVAALWAASGWSTAVGDGRVVARRHDPATERVEVAVVTGPAGVGRVLVAGAVDADLLVAPVGARTARALAARTGLEVVDAAGLHERLTYGVEAGVRERILETHVPASPRTPSRRALLGALAAAVGAAGATTLGPAVADELAPSAGAGDEQPGTPTVADGAASPTPTPPATTGLGPSSPVMAVEPSPDHACEMGPAETVAQRLGSVMQFLALGGGTDVDGDGKVEYVRPEPTEAFLDAIREAGDDPIRYAVSATVGRPVEVGGVTRVPATVVTSGDDRVVYQFTMNRTFDGCWRTRSAEIVATREG